jgi:uncharacterized membrane protein
MTTTAGYGTETRERTRSRVPAGAWEGNEPTLPERGGEGLARALGWFSIGLGATQLLAPRRLARMIGVDDDGRTVVLMRSLGMRELATGIAILSQPDNPRWLAARVGGDVMDLALLGSAMRRDDDDEERSRRTGMAAAAVVGAGLLDALATRQVAQRHSGNGSGGIEVHKTMTVARSPEEAYRLWRDFEGFPRFMRHLESVQVTGERTSHWVAKGPAGMRVEWDAEILEDRPGELISWRSLPDAEVANAGIVRFKPAPGNRGAEVHVQLHYAPPAGRAGAAFAKLFGREPSQEVEGDLRRFKQVLEVGEVVHSDASIHRGPHPAQPSEEPTT